MWKGLGRASAQVGRGRVQRLLRQAGIQGAKRSGRQEKLVPRQVPPVSLLLTSQRDDYVRELTAYRKKRLEEWCLDAGGGVPP